MRKVTGKKVSTLRAEGLIPAVVYGKKFENLNLTLDLKEFMKVYGQAGESELVDIVTGEGDPVKVLVKALQYDPISDEVIHVDFHKVDLTEKVTAPIPVVISGVPEIVESGDGILLTLHEQLEVEALPLDLPSEITVDVSGLKEVGDTLQIKDLTIDKEKINFTANPEEPVVKIDYAEQLEEEEPEEEAEVEITKEKEGEEAPEGEEDTETEEKEAPEQKPQEEEKK